MTNTTKRKPQAKAKTKAKAKPDKAQKPAPSAVHDHGTSENTSPEQVKGRDLSYEQAMELSIEQLEALCVSPKELRFVHEYIADLNGTQAAIRSGYSAKTANQIAHAILAKPYIRALVDLLKRKVVEAVDSKVEDVLREFVRIAHVDRRKLTEYRRRCCRHCWGENFAYQETPGEYARRKADFERRREDAEAGGRKPPYWDPTRVIGYDARKGPNPECPECFGEGEGYVHINDTRHLDDDVATVYDGVKETKDGIEVKTCSREKALDVLARYHKLYEDKTEVTVNLDAETLEEKFMAKMRQAHERMQAVRGEREPGGQSG